MLFKAFQRTKEKILRTIFHYIETIQQNYLFKAAVETLEKGVKYIPS